jgi:glucose-6-phosphate 1-dehydrogenase
MMLIDDATSEVNRKIPRTSTNDLEPHRTPAHRISWYHKSRSLSFYFSLLFRKKANNQATIMAEPATNNSAMQGSTPEQMEWLTSSGLCVVVVGASGDLAKKKTYPSLLNLYHDNLLPKDTLIWGYARSKMTDDELRDRIRPFLLKTDHSPEVVEGFLARCRYQGGKSYGDIDAFMELKGSMEAHEASMLSKKNYNRLFYFAIPPNVFAETGLAIKITCMQAESKGWTRLIVEKPFGRDLATFEELNTTLSKHFTENHLYRIDHYLGKEMVQNLSVLRFSNVWFEKIWNAQNVACVILTFKEPFGTDGRGGYFDQYGIIRDILQNHLLQVLTLMAMEVSYE